MDVTSSDEYGKPTYWYQYRLLLYPASRFLCALENANNCLPGIVLEPKVKLDIHLREEVCCFLVDFGASDANNLA
jgi:hypothetical protein